MSIYDQISGAKVQNRGVKIQEDADFVVRIDRIKIEQSNQGFGQLWVVEFTIQQGTDNNPAGTERSWVQRPEHRSQTDPGNIKAFIAALEGIADANATVIPPDTVLQAVSEAQPYRGRRLRLSTQMVKTRGDFDFCVHTWSPYGEEVRAPTTTTTTTNTAAPPPPPPPAAPTAPQPPPVLTEAAWKSGQGDAQQHPDNPAYEWNPEHPEWGVRPRS